MSREAFESRYDKSRLRRWAGGIYPDEYSDPQVQLDWALWQAAQADAFERAAKVCEAVSDEYQQREGMRYPEMKTDAETGAEDCAEAIRALAKEPKQ